MVLLCSDSLSGFGRYFLRHPFFDGEDGSIAAEVGDQIFLKADIIYTIPRPQVWYS